MKLYTKEMFLVAAEKCEVSMIDAEHIMKYIDDYVTPTELPSDEEIEVESFVFNPINLELEDDWDKNKQYRDEFIKGAKWLKEQILNQKL